MIIFILSYNFKRNILEVINLILDESRTFSTFNMLEYKNKLKIEYTYDNRV